MEIKVDVSRPRAGKAGTRVGVPGAFLLQKVQPLLQAPFCLDRSFRTKTTEWASRIEPALQRNYSAFVGDQGTPLLKDTGKSPDG